MPHVNGELLYLQKLDKYKAIKPFSVIFDVTALGPDKEQTNVRLEPRNVSFVDMKTSEQTFRLDHHGFELRSFPTSLGVDDFKNEDIIKNRYYPELEAFLHEVLGPKLDRVFFLNHQLRRRSKQFPKLVLEEIETFQPVPRAHCDYSPRGAIPQLNHIFEEDETLRDRDFQIMNVWRVLRGPNRDWPLAVCDHSTVDLENDVEFCDFVGREDATEGLEFYHNPNHMWYFVEDQMPNEVIVFNNCHSRSLKVPFAAHAAFDNHPEDMAKSPRESFEIRSAPDTLDEPEAPGIFGKRPRHPVMLFRSTRIVV